MAVGWVIRYRRFLGDSPSHLCLVLSKVDARMPSLLVGARLVVGSVTGVSFSPQTIGRICNATFRIDALLLIVSG